jgi:hypothetical protein
MALIAHPPSVQQHPDSHDQLGSGLWTCVAVGVIVGLTAALAAFIANGLLTFP